MPTEIHKLKRFELPRKARPSAAIESSPSVDAYSIPSKPCALDYFLTRPEFCRRYGITLRTAEMMAHRGKGPKVTHLGKRAYYHVDDIAAWCDAERAKAEARFASQYDA